jgi:hypothetical protein
MHALTGRPSTPAGEEVGMSGSDSTFVLVATYPDEATAQQDYQVVKDAHTAGLVGSYDAAVVTKDASGKVHENKDETATRHGAWWGVAAGAALGVIFPPSVLGESKVEDAIKHDVTRAEKQTAKELDVDPKDIDKTLRETVREM